MMADDPLAPLRAIRHPTTHPVLDAAITQAWQAVQQDSHARMPLPLLLPIYDALIGDLGITMRRLTASSSLAWFPRVTPGLKRYWYLGLQTVRPLLPLWDQALARWCRDHPEADPDWPFPQVILTATEGLLRGLSEAVVAARIPDTMPDVSAWHAAVGELDEMGLPAPAIYSLRAVYAVHAAVCGLVPFRGPIADDTTVGPTAAAVRLELDWAAAACLAVCSHQAAMAVPAQYQQRTAQDFWAWWLFERVPEAAAVDVDALDWGMTTCAWWPQATP